MRRNSISMIKRCAKHQTEDAAGARANELEPVNSRESAPAPSVDYLPEVQPPTQEEEIIS